MSCPECEELRAENARLRNQAQQAQRLSASAILREAFGLGGRSAALLVALYGANGEMLARDELRALLNDHGERDNSLRVYVQRLRDLLGADSILNVRGKGYQLSSGGLERVAAVLNAPTTPAQGQAA